MSRLIYVDVLGGAAGDMILAALLDAGADLDEVRSAVNAVVPGRFTIDTEIVRRSGLRARLLRVRVAAARTTDPVRGTQHELDVRPEVDLPPRP